MLNTSISSNFGMKIDYFMTTSYLKITHTNQKTRSTARFFGVVLDPFDENQKNKIYKYHDQEDQLRNELGEYIKWLTEKSEITHN